MTTNARLQALLDKAYWGWDPAKIPDAPVAALRGVSDADAVELGHSLGIRTIRDLATNRFVLAAQELLQAYLNRPSARIALVRLADLDEDTREVMPPGHGESLSDVWAFYLSIRDFSDHGYWALIPRANPTTGLIYGFH